VYVELYRRIDRLADWRVAAGIKPLPIWNDSSMAIIFELVVNFGLHDNAVVDATERLDRKPTIEVRGVQLPITPPFVTTLETSGFSSFPCTLAASAQGVQDRTHPSTHGTWATTR
jgi:hypothetical protein